MKRFINNKYFRCRLSSARDKIIVKREFLSAVIVAFLGMTANASAFGLTADQMYRNLIQTEKSGGRASTGEPLLSFKKAESKPEEIWREKKAIFERKMPQPADFSDAYDWKKIVVAVKKGNVTPFDVDEIRRQSERENVEAIELLAWMYATGTGLRQDLPKSYAYYMQAAQMGVASAYDNVRAVYQAMNPAQREALSAF